jgi:D-alanyl-D-alanine carboxypeptidase
MIKPLFINFRKSVAIVLLFSLGYIGDCNAVARRSIANNNKKRAVPSKVVQIQQMPKYASIVVNANSGKIIHQTNSKEKRHPASLTKMMTLYITFDALKSGRLSMDQEIPVSALAARQPCSCLPINAGETMTVREAIYGAVVKSANNASYVLSEAIAGNSTKFVMLMNAKAKHLGMKDTNFANPDGWHNIKNYTTAHDMAILSIALKRDHAKYYPIFSAKSFRFRGQEISSHNYVMMRYPHADGLKTGYTRPSGFNLATSANKDGSHLVAVVMGAASAKTRDDHMITLLEMAYDNMPITVASNQKRGDGTSVFSRLEAQS